MVKQRITKYTLYRYRYALAYTAFAIALVTMLLLAGFYLPGGITKLEMRSVLLSDAVSFTNVFSLPPDQLLYLPYRLLQSLSLDLFGVSILGIKLPSIILGFSSAIGLLYLLSLWYRKNVAIIVAIVAVTTNQFLLASQAGQAGIMYIFLTVMVLIAASLIARKSAYAKVWTIVGFGLAGLSLYMPLTIYVLLALVLTALFHPHARHLIMRESSRVTVAIGAAVGILSVLPLIIGIIKDPSIISSILGIPSDFTNIGGKAMQLIQNYTQFMSPTAGDIITPVYGLGLVVLIIVGVYRLLTTKYTARCYVISFWLLTLIPMVLLNPQFVSITFVPVMLLAAFGVEYLIKSWYSLFPRNPYARVIGLVPLGILLIGLVFASVDRYAYGLHYDTAVYNSYNYDIPLLNKKLKNIDSSEKVILLVNKDDAQFYKIFAAHQNYIDSLRIATSTDTAKNADIVIAERSFAKAISTSPTEILVTRASHNANRFYLYKNNAS